MSSIFNNLFVFEMANNHEGSVELGLRITREMGDICREFDIRGTVKLQYRHLDTMIHPAYRAREDIQHIPRFMRTRLSDAQFKELVDATKSEGLLTCCTPFDERSVDLVVEHGVDIVKVASCSGMDWPLLERIVRTKLPISCSSGGRSLDEIDEIVSFFMHFGVTDLALMHCVSTYPTNSKDANIHFMNAIMRRHPKLPIGYSGHEAADNHDIAKIAVAAGAQIMERHVGIPYEGKKLNAYSMSPDEVRQWVEAVLLARDICGDGEVRPAGDAESASLMTLERGIWAKEAIASGERLCAEQVFLAMPCREGQLTARAHISNVTATRDYAPGEPIKEQVVAVEKDRIIGLAMREARNMLAISNVQIGSEYTVEISHHYGVEKLRDFGAIILNLINREYCKKILVVLPGQQHPSHHHIRKEECFHLLYGDISLCLNGRRINMREGDVQLVPRNCDHSFSSDKGAIIEEVSTQHFVGDSIYEDKSIVEMGIDKRKSTFRSLWSTPDMPYVEYAEKDSEPNEVTDTSA